MRALRWGGERFHRMGEHGGVVKKGKQTQERTNQPPDIISVLVSGEGDNLGQEELTRTHFQAGRQTMSHIHKYLLASTK